jgi:hypothetical protein
VSEPKVWTIDDFEVRGRREITLRDEHYDVTIDLDGDEEVCVEHEVDSENYGGGSRTVRCYVPVAEFERWLKMVRPSSSTAPRADAPPSLRQEADNADRRNAELTHAVVDLAQARLGDAEYERITAEALAAKADPVLAVFRATQGEGPRADACYRCGGTGRDYCPTCKGTGSRHVLGYPAAPPPQGEAPAADGVNAVVRAACSAADSLEWRDVSGDGGSVEVRTVGLDEALALTEAVKAYRAQAAPSPRQASEPGRVPAETIAMLERAVEASTGIDVETLRATPLDEMHKLRIPARQPSDTDTAAPTNAGIGAALARACTCGVIGIGAQHASTCPAFYRRG